MPIAQQIWAENHQEMMDKLRENDPDHLQSIMDGWSWIELVGGPRDGGFMYFVGSPCWNVLIVRECEKTCWLYELAECPEGGTIYKFSKEIKR